MVGQNVYTEQEIRFILDLLINEAKGPEISEAYDKEFGKPLTPNQLRYVKNKYGKDPKYGTAAINSSMNKNNKHSNKRKQMDDGAGRDQAHPFPSFEINRASNQASPFPGFEESKAAHDSANAFSCFGENSSEQGFAPEPQVIPDSLAHGSDNILWSVPQYPGPQAHPQPLLYQPLNAQQLSMMPQASPSQNYHQPTAPKTELEDFTHAMAPPVAVPTNEPISYQQQDHVSNGGEYQMMTAWDSNNPELQALGGITDLQPIQRSSAAPSAYAPAFNQLPLQNTTRTAQQQQSIAPSPQLASPPHYPPPAQAPRSRPTVQAVQQYSRYMQNQSADLLSPPNDASAINPQPATVPYYGAGPQSRQVEEFRKSQQIPMQQMIAARQTKRTLDWNQYSSPQPHNPPQHHQNPPQQQPQTQPAMFSLSPNTQTAHIETASLASNPPTTNALPNPSMVQASPSFNTTNMAPASPATTRDVVSTQTSGLKSSHQPNLDDVLTGHFDAADYEFFVHSTPDEFALEQVSSVTALHPGFEPHEAQNEAVNLDTIDPKLLDEMCVLPPLKREDTATPPEDGPQTPAVPKKLSGAI
ncbi:hypothetical protein BGZ61DRAFT_473572 [Ilyonectria robusta]|uniref:uncharacterized protein n=1 Tax=Ilyonectria robusta TaxID=1079257 RepID=UPI001E8CD130|nr:uncharacterized protein BGZ61DRAFT_473572 [Ilyonectria robusta]KAH8734902.1 hypothetical protein BGZ61DRAFT_473572 [Ilyonectria robusta]